MLSDSSEGSTKAVTCHINCETLFQAFFAFALLEHAFKIIPPNASV
jgi:hypothetical protein